MAAMAAMAKRSYMGVVAVCFVLLLVWASVTWDEHHFFERPVQYSLITLSVAGAALLCLSKTDLPLKVGRSPERKLLKKSDEGYRPLRGTDRSDDIELLTRHRRTASSKDTEEDDVLDALIVAGNRPGLIQMHLAAVALCVALRVGISVKTLEAPQCTINNLEKISLPVILALLDYIHGKAYKKTAQDEHDSISNTAFEDLWDFFRYTRFRYVALAVALSWSLYLLGPPAYTSTAMCMGISRQRATTVAFQLMGIALDVVIILLSWETMLYAADDNGKDRRAEVMGRITFVSVILLCIGGIVGLLFNLGSVADILTTSSALKINAFVDGLALALLLFCLSYLMKDLRPFAMVFIAAFFCVVVPLILRARGDRKPFPPQLHGTKIFGLVMASVTFLTFMVTYHASELKDAPNNILKRINFLWYILLIGGMIFGVVAVAIRSSYVGFHPIKLMMYRANDASTHWSKKALVSKSLTVAVTEYATRYHRLPPPNFDAWYNFANDRDCKVIDDYDQIDADLLPFWGIPPSIIRANSVPKTNAIGTIRINMDGPGVVVAGEKESMPMAEMIGNFAEWLPPMQILIHRHVDPIVAVSHWKRTGLEQKAIAEIKKPKSPAVGNWTEYNAENWPKIPSQKILPEPEMSSLHLSKWDAYLRLSCPMFSPARQNPHFSDKLCIQCVSPHSINQFMWNTTKALDICHQPDLYSISNFLASPATAPLSGYPASELVPIFSPRKVDGYNDILYPAPGSYIQRDATSSPPNLNFALPEGVAEKKYKDLSNSLFWFGQRPLTSGLTTNSWQGLAEQRLVQFARWKGETGKEKVPFLLPIDQRERYYLNAFVKLGGLGPQLPVKANFTVSSPATDCQKPQECESQDKFFGVETFDKSERTHEESRFNHRFSLTMDTDAPHKFVQDLQSNSAPVQSTIFREWFTPRLTPWLHYIPLDMRWHGLHSTLAYFMGIEGEVKGREARMKKRGGDALAIAREGRKRAELMMREKDAEVYFFRLLLEWGRLVDDNREHLGYVQ